MLPWRLCIPGTPALPDRSFQWLCPFTVLNPFITNSIAFNYRVFESAGGGDNLKSVDRAA
jgi:hypothetical protein